jgi:hypothetical protein
MNHENETYINGIDIWITYNARLIHDSFVNLLLPENRKEYVENNERNQPGKQIFVSNPQPSDKEVQLSFLIEGNDKPDFLEKYRQLVSLLENGMIELKAIPVQMVYKLTMDSTMSLDIFGNDNSGILVVKFNEPNPKDRKSTLVTAYVLSSDNNILTSNNKILTTIIE